MGSLHITNVTDSMPLHTTHYFDSAADINFFGKSSLHTLPSGFSVHKMNAHPINKQITFLLAITLMNTLNKIKIALNKLKELWFAHFRILLGIQLLYPKSNQQTTD